MNINAITSLRQIGRNFLPKAPSFLGTINSIPNDSFERTTPKKSESENGAIKWIEDNDYVRTKLIKTLNNPDNLLGSGFNHSAYVIPETDDYIFRVKKNFMPRQLVNEYEIKDVEDKKLPINIGQVLAEISLDEKVYPDWQLIQVLKRQNGEPLGIKPPSATFYENGELREGELPYDDISRKETYERTIHKVAQMPVEAYEKLLENLEIASQNGYNFDYYNSNNILVDEENQALNLIDMDAVGEEVDYGSVLFALTNVEYLDVFKSKHGSAIMDDKRVEGVVNDTIEIIDKYIQAMKNKGFKFDRQTSSVYFQKFLSSIPAIIYFKTFDIKEKWNKLEEMGLVKNSFNFN